MAWFTPLDQMNAIGQYSRRVTGLLAKDHEVHMYNELVELNALDHYDMIVYNIGDVLFDHKISDIMRAKAGIVIVHKNNKVNLEFALGIVTHTKGQPARSLNGLELCIQLPFSDQQIEKYSEKLIAFIHEIRGIKPFLNLIDKATNELNLMGVKGEMPVINTVSQQILTMFGK